VTVTYVLWAWSVLTLLIDILIVVWLWPDDRPESVPGQPSAVTVCGVTLSGPTQMWIVIGLFISNVTMIICAMGLVMGLVLSAIVAVV
jgi:hypothetical protein